MKGDFFAFFTSSMVIVITQDANGQLGVTASQIT